MATPHPLRAPQQRCRPGPGPGMARWPQRHGGASATGAPASTGPQDAGTDALFAAVYDRLKLMAGRRRARAHGTLETTALVHELYLRMNVGEIAFAHPSQFLTYAARAMRHLLVDRARQRLSKRSGGDWLQVTLTGVDQSLAIESAERALAIDQTLRNLAAVDRRAAQVVELLYFAGLTREQAGELLDLSRRTIDRDWQFARAFIKAELGDAE